MWPAQIPIEDFLAITERADGPILHDGNLARRRKDSHSMGNDDHRDIGGLHLLNGVVEHALAHVIQACVRFVENHETRLAKKKRAQDPDAGGSRAKRRSPHCR